MDLQAEKIELAKLLLSTDNPKIINAIKRIFKKEGTKDFWDELTPAQQTEIKQGLEEIEKGKVTDYNSFIAKYK